MSERGRSSDVRSETGISLGALCDTSRDVTTLRHRGRRQVAISFSTLMLSRTVQRVRAQDPFFFSLMLYDRPPRVGYDSRLADGRVSEDWRPRPSLMTLSSLVPVSRALQAMTTSKLIIFRSRRLRRRHKGWPIGSEGALHIVSEKSWFTNAVYRPPA